MTSKVDWGAALAYVAGGGLTTVAIAFGDAFPGHAKQIVAVSGGAVFVAGLLLRLFKNPSPPPGTQAVFTTAVPPKTATLTTTAQEATKDTQ